MINIGTNIKAILTEPHLNSLLGGDDRICPIVMPEEMDYPFIVYRATGLDNDDNKDVTVDVDIVTMIVVAADYDASVDIAMKVRDLMENYTDSKINDIKLRNRQEDQNADAFLQILTFNVENNKQYDI